MTYFNRIFLTLVVVAVLLTAAAAIDSSKAASAVWAAADGKGSVTLLWMPAPGQWPVGGWRVLDDQNRTLVERIHVAEPETMRALSTTDQENVRKFADELRSGKVLEQAQVVGLVAARAMGDPAFARAMGLTATIEITAGTHVFRVIALDASGKPTNVSLKTEPIDTSVATPAPPAPTGVKASVVQRIGVGLSWTPVPENQKLPVIAYRVERVGAGMLTPRPLVLGVRWDAERPIFVDEKAPTEEELAYRISSIDLFGRASAPVEIRFFMPDTLAIEAPAGLRARAGINKVSLEWKPSDNPHTAGYIVERSKLHGGPYVALTATALPRATKSYDDADILGGSAYFYRLRSMDARGNLGAASVAVLGVPENASRPPRPSKPQIDIGRTRVRLTWEALAFPLAGYFIERQSEGETRWVRLNSRVTPEPLFDDYFGLNTFGKFTYRIVAIADDNKESEPSPTVHAVIEDRSSPAPPTIMGADGGSGKVLLNFVPAAPEARTAQFLIVRGDAAEDPGLVIGDPLPTTSRTFEDAFVQSGRDYWYRVVALDTRGNRSEFSNSVVVRVGVPSIPKPPIPSVKRLNEPFPAAEITFAPPSAPLFASVQVRRGDSSSWLTIAGPLQSENKAVDTRPAQGDRSFYRVVYETPNGAQGPPSDEVMLSAATAID